MSVQAGRELSSAGDTASASAVTISSNSAAHQAPVRLDRSLACLRLHAGCSAAERRGCGGATGGRRLALLGQDPGVPVFGLADDVPQLVVVSDQAALGQLADQALGRQKQAGPAKAALGCTRLAVRNRQAMPDHERLDAAR